MIGRSGSAAVRLLLLGLLTLGVVGMHTLGHPSSHDAPAMSTSAGAPHSPHSSQPSEHVDLATADTAGMGMGGDAPSIIPGMHLAVSSHQPGGPGMGLDPLSVCLGVLTMLGLMIAGRLVRLLRDDGTAVRRHLGTGVGGSGTRGPPDLPAVGLHLADLSVQRI
ncbi:hypothetical protein SAMN05421678_116174 [Actinopolymorpha cephalotaxi]|uniref:Uncharacterized protein n=1 Tax=Actinopolymorpha cephalotaxi TaxID=504797 RepID=A0A1I2ZM31_9ACTN|nr:hypothetical protein [Actinopolymorpha cephalotaxi]NYH82061.1 hypothetical protein [Actinopolymorpha cephalotaxi]SFH38549.1 hypothetical protein SAMN05421678_116174 [Actinopolymorpha cephalotaxi]